MLSGAAKPVYLATGVGAGGGGGGVGAALATGAAEALGGGAADVTGGGGGGAGGGGSSPPHQAASRRPNERPNEGPNEGRRSDFLLMNRIMAKGLLDGRFSYHVRTTSAGAKSGATPATERHNARSTPR